MVGHPLLTADIVNRADRDYFSGEISSRTRPLVSGNIHRTMIGAASDPITIKDRAFQCDPIMPNRMDSVIRLKAPPMVATITRVPEAVER